MAVGILVMLYVNHPVLPEMWDGIQNTHPNAAILPVFPIMFVSIACGAISGFHATQSPMMARCMKSEKYGRPVFYGAMITEGIVALIWAAAATYFYHENGMAENNASVIVDAITKSWLGSVGGILAILGVIAAPITSGDTAFRSARLIVADFMGMEQKSIRRRLYICIPMFVAAIGLLPAAMSHGIGSESQRPLAIVIIGGLIGATFFALFIFPLIVEVVYERMLYDKNGKLLQRRI